MKRIIIYILIFLIIITCGCADKKTVIPKHGTSIYNDSSINLSRDTKTLDINIDSGNLQVFCWDKKNIKVETKHTVRDNKTNEELEELLKKYTLVSKEKENTLFFTDAYDGTIKDPQDIYSDIKLTIPKKIKILKISQKYGSIIIRDKFEGDIEANLDYVNSEIKSLKGQLLYKCEDGNLRVSSSSLLGNSSVNINSGNIYVKAQCQKKSNYSFKTKNGNIELLFPTNSNIKLNNTGIVKKNAFQETDGDINVEADAVIGEISIDMY